MSSSSSQKKRVSLGKVSSISANGYKLEGNKFFYSKSFDEAIRCYDKAIELNSCEAVFFTNRALSNIQLRRWSQVVADCRRAFEIDPYLVKAYVFLGHALLELEHFDDSIASLNKAEQLMTSQNRNANEEVQGLLRLARKRKQASQEEEQLRSMFELRDLLRRLLKMKKDRLFRKMHIGDDCDEEDAGDEYKDISNVGNKDDEKKFNKEEKDKWDDESSSNDKGSFKSDRVHDNGAFGDDNGENNCGDAKEKKRLMERYDRMELELEELFEKAITQRKKRDVLDALCGKISFELLRDPVITPAGITYDRLDIEQHLLRVGHFDPISRCTLTLDNLIPNIALKEFIEKYLAKHPWAEFC